MKKLLAILCAAILTGALLCGCSGKDNQTMGDDMATIASEVKDNVDNMVDNGKVDDGDGYIGDNTQATERPTERNTEPTVSTDASEDNDSILDIGDDPTDAEDFI